MTMQDWVTTVKMQTNGPPDDDTLVALIEGLASRNVGGVTVSDSNTISVTCTTPAKRAHQAADDVSKAIDRIIRAKHDIEGVVSISVLDAETRDAVQDAGYQPMVGVAELAQIIGMSKQTASRLARSRDFPPPAAHLIAGPVWNTIDVFRHIRSKK